MAQRTITFASASAILGGWLPIMAPAVVTIALRFREFNATGVDSTYAIVLGLGWLTLIVSLMLAGYVGDALERRGRKRSALVRVSIPLIALGGLLMALAPSTWTLAAVWMVIQVPSAAVITTAMATGGAHLRSDPRSLVSGWAGAMPILALLFGTIGARAVSDSLEWAFILPAIAGAALSVPLAVARPEESLPLQTPSRATPVSSAITGLWLTFLVASFLLAWSTSTVNGFVVVFVQERISPNFGDIADISTLTVILASSLAMVASIATGRFAHGPLSSLRVWWLAAAACAAVLAVLIAAPSSFLLLFMAAVFGVAFGAANGVELAAVVTLRDHDSLLGRDMGTLTAATTVPYVLVPAVASLLLIESAGTGVTVLFGIAALAAAIGAVLMLVGISRNSIVGSR